ncbi:hypothetical protein RugamoR64_12630 [Duganella rhizosphaerae]|uniref:hypothetical protein n=1 Tax=Duganella rhizosphaerae TaxID=2885763 RepID=UPI0030EA6474
MMWLIRVVLLAAACALAGAPARAAEEVVGMVLDVQGNGELVRNTQHSKLQLLNYVKPGEQLRLDAGARASVSHYGAKLIYQLTGPVLAEVDPGAIRVLSGTALATKSLAEKVVLAALSPNTGPAAFKMRAIMLDVTLLGPKNGTLALNTRPQFRWEANEATSYTFTLERADGAVVAQFKTDASAWEPPPAAPLAYGQSYRWSVAYTSAVDGEARQATAQFQVASEAEHASLVALRPGAGAPIDEWVLYASLLQNRQMLDDARAVWQEIAARRPDLSKAGSLAR